MKQATKERIMQLHNRGLSVHYIEKQLGVKHWKAQEIIEEELKEDYNSLFK